jgi:hypothetical protein
MLISWLIVVGHSSSGMYGIGAFKDARCINSLKLHLIWVWLSYLTSVSNLFVHLRNLKTVM